MKFNVKGYVDLNLVKGFIDLTLESDELDQFVEPQSNVHTSESSVKVPLAQKNSTYRAGEILDRGDAVYIDPMSRAFKASAVKVCGGDDSYKSQVDGFVAVDAGIGEGIELVDNNGTVFPRIDGKLIVGKCVYLSTIPGKVSSKVPTEKGTFRLKLGTARGSDEMAIKLGQEPIFNS